MAWGPLYRRTRGASSGWSDVDHLQRALELLLAVEADVRDVVGEDVAQQALHERELAVQEGGGALARGLRADLVPGPGEVLHVALEVLAGAAGPDRARDQAAAAALLPQLLQDRLQPSPLVVVGDLARDAHVLDGGHEHEVAPGQRDVGRDARALLPQGFLDHLDEHFLPRLEHLLDGLGAPVVVARGRGRGRDGGRLPVAGRGPGVGGGGGGRRRGRLPGLLGREEVLVELVDHVGDVEERVAFQAEVDEGRLHPGKDPGHLALIEVADDPAVGFPLDEDLGNDAVVQERDLGLLGRAADDEVLGHGRSLP